MLLFAWDGGRVKCLYLGFLKVTRSQWTSGSGLLQDPHPWCIVSSDNVDIDWIISSVLKIKTILWCTHSDWRNIVSIGHLNSKLWTVWLTLNLFSSYSIGIHGANRNMFYWYLKKFYYLLYSMCFHSQTLQVAILNEILINTYIHTFTLLVKEVRGGMRGPSISSGLCGANCKKMLLSCRM